MKVRCGVYGEGSVFSLDIEGTAEVEALQEAIFDKQRYHERFSFPASALTLYLAKKDGAWLKSDATLKPLLKQGRQEDIDTTYKRMFSWWKLNKTEYFGDFQLGEEEIHVLVELPEAAAGEKSVTAKLVKEIHDQVVQTKRKRYVHSEMSSNKGNALLQDLDIRVKPVGTVPFTARDPAPVQGFKWESVCDGRGQNIALTEEQQRERYRDGIRAAIERYYDIASVLGPDIDMARAAANQIARTIPDVDTLRDAVKVKCPNNLANIDAADLTVFAVTQEGKKALEEDSPIGSFAFQREVDVNFALGSHANIVQFVKSFSIGNTENEQRHIIVMPFFARCAADLLTQQSPIELRALITIAHNCFEALCHIHSKKYCFADLKPANIMLHSGEQGGATLVDFGGAVRLGNPIVEVTDQFCLDVAKLQGLELLDWTCLGTTMAQLANIDITK
ncbi:putative protein kinase [Plasmopara halstedii]